MTPRLDQRFPALMLMSAAAFEPVGANEQSPLLASGQVGRADRLADKPNDGKVHRCDDQRSFGLQVAHATEGGANGGGAGECRK